MKQLTLSILLSLQCMCVVSMKVNLTMISYYVKRSAPELQLKMFSIRYTVSFNLSLFYVEYLCGVCTDGAPAMLGCRSGFQTLVKQVSPRTTGIHCTIHRQVLASKTLPNTFKDVLTDVVKAINAIKSKST